MFVVFFVIVVVDISLLRYEKRKLFKIMIIVVNYVVDYKMVMNNIFIVIEDVVKSLFLEFLIFFLSYVIIY